MNEIKYPNSYVVWDLETSGLDPKTCKILEIGCMVVDEGKTVLERSWLLNHGIQLSEEITNITGIDNALIDKEGLDPKAVMHEFFAILQPKGKPTPDNLTHNGIRFDIPFLVEQSRQMYQTTEGRIAELEQSLFSHAIDSAVFVKAGKMSLERYWNESFREYADRVMAIKAYCVKYNVALCVEEMQIPKPEDKEYHRALGDVYFTNEIYKQIIKI